MADKKISELPIVSSIAIDDISVLVGSDTDYQFSFTTLLDFVDTNLTVGAKITFGNVIPQNTTGNNGDVFLKTDTAVFYQKVNGIWISVYQISTGSAADGTMLYDIGLPAASFGSNNDSYIDTTTGIFYLKAAGSWSQVFSMATGPQGPQGTPGTNGINGTNGNTILNGTTNPSNTTDGVNGDFYINTSTNYLFGPKTNGLWPAGVSIVGSPPEPLIINISKGSQNPYYYQWQGSGYDNIYGKLPSVSVDVEISGSVNSLNAFTSGSGYTDGTYNLVPLTGGSGTGVRAKISISAGQLATIAIVYGGQGYAVGDVLSVANSNLGGNGSGLTAVVSGTGKSWQKSAVNVIRINDSTNEHTQFIYLEDPDPDDSTKLADNLMIIITQ
jgi:hypothetical protein